MSLSFADGVEVPARETAFPPLNVDAKALKKENHVIWQSKWEIDWIKFHSYCIRTRQVTWKHLTDKYQTFFCESGAERILTIGLYLQKLFCFFSCKARRTWWNKTEIKHWNCFSLISIFFSTAKLFHCFSFIDVGRLKKKQQLNNAAGGRLYFTRPHIHPWNWNKKQNCRRSTETNPRPSAVLFYFSFILPCATGLTRQRGIKIGGIFKTSNFTR